MAFAKRLLCLVVLELVRLTTLAVVDDDVADGAVADAGAEADEPACERELEVVRAISPAFSRARKQQVSVVVIKVNIQVGKCEVGMMKECDQSQGEFIGFRNNLIIELDQGWSFCFGFNVRAAE